MAVEEDVQHLAQDLLPRSRHVALAVTERVLAQVHELAPAGIPDSADFVRESTEQNTGAVLSMLAFGTVPGPIEPPPGTLKVLQYMVAAGADVTTVLHGYRVAHAGVWLEWLAHVGGSSLSAPRQLAVLQHSSERMFSYFDGAAARYVERFRAELPGPDRGASTREVLEAVLRGQRLDTDDLRARLNYDLRGHHLALCFAPLRAGADPRAALSQVAAAAALPSALVQPQSDGTLWAWLGSAQALAPDVLESVAALRLDGVVAGMGEPAHGFDGFRQSHEQARRAERTGRLTPAPVHAVVRHRQVELASLLCADPQRARQFAIDRLRGLAVRDDSGERLRETLRTYFAVGSSKSRAAAHLHVHQKTVAYRLRQAEDLLGRPLDGQVSELEAALFVDLTLNGP